MCRGCREVLPLSAFHKQKQTLFGVNNHCKECRKPKSKALYAETTWESRIFYRAKARALKKGIPFTIREEDIVIPKKCPVFHVPLSMEANSPYSPSLDQINPGRGYTPDNIVVMSTRANMLKNNATLAEVRMLFEYLSK